MAQAVAGEPGEAHHQALRADPPGAPADGRATAVARRPGGAGHAGRRAGRQAPGRRPPPPSAPQIVIAGAHGGAGVTTLAALLRLEFAGAPAGQAAPDRRDAARPGRGPRADRGGRVAAGPAAAARR